MRNPVKSAGGAVLDRHAPLALARRAVEALERIADALETKNNTDAAAPKG